MAKLLDHPRRDAVEAAIRASAGANDGAAAASGEHRHEPWSECAANSPVARSPAAAFRPLATADATADKCSAAGTAARHAHRDGRGL